MDTPNAAAATKILVIVAGTNEPSNSNVLADAMMEGVKSTGATVTKLRLKDMQIAHFGLECYGPHCPVDDLERVKAEIGSAHGVIIATPIWNFSVPAHLKNLIDRMGAFALDEQAHSLGQFHGKPFFLL